MQKELLEKVSVSEDEVSTIDLRMHTIILLVGPSGCGKTYFTEKNIIPQVKEKGFSFAHLSSDSIRRELIGDMGASKMDPRMSYASKAAFSLLNAKLRALTSYPINTEFVVVDSTGLSKDFRDDIKKIAEENNYNLVVVVFDYKGRSPYYDYITDEESKAVTSRQIDYMRKDVMSEISKKNYRDIYKVKSRDFDKYKINFSNVERYQECKLSEELDYVIIGDIHGCYKEFVALLEKNGFEIDKENKKIIGHKE